MPQGLPWVPSVLFAPACADEVTLARKAAIVLQLITYNFLSLLCQQIIRSQYAFSRHNGATIFYTLARAAGAEITSPM